MIALVFGLLFKIKELKISEFSDALISTWSIGINSGQFLLFLSGESFCNEIVPIIATVIVKLYLYLST